MVPKIRVLALDGGGIRGVISATMLVALEEKLQALAGPRTRVADFFDLVAGTSTGALLACGLLTPERSFSRPRYSAQALLDIYREHGADMFPNTLLQRLTSLDGLSDERFSADAFEVVLRQKFGDLTMADLLRPALITAYDIERAKAAFFRQEDARARRDRNFRVRDVARASSAAPTYFEAIDLTPVGLDPADLAARWALVDGGVFANNPAMCAIAHVSKNWGVGLGDVMLLSLGTGELKQDLDFERVRDWGKLEWAKPLIDILLAAGQNTVDYQLRALFAGAGVPTQYLRVQFWREPGDGHTPGDRFGPLPFSPDLTDTSPDNIERLFDAAQDLRVRACEREDWHPWGGEAPWTFDQVLSDFAQRLVEEGPIPY